MYITERKLMSPKEQITEPLSIVTTGIILEVVILNQKMADLVNLNTKLLQDAILMDSVIENFACFHMKYKTRIF